jgi:hypothetical protein
MSKYNITNYTRKQAKRLGVTVKQSRKKDKKIDVFIPWQKAQCISTLAPNKSHKCDLKVPRLKKDKLIASVGANGMNDFPTYIKKRGLKYAKTRRRLYKIRHEKDRHEKWTNGWLADKLLW